MCNYKSCFCLTFYHSLMFVLIVVVVDVLSSWSLIYSEWVRYVWSGGPVALPADTDSGGFPVRLLVPGDTISADGGVGVMCAELKVCALTGGCKRRRQEWQDTAMCPSADFRQEIVEQRWYSSALLSYAFIWWLTLTVTENLWIPYGVSRSSQYVQSNATQKL